VRGERELIIERRDAQHGERRAFDSADWMAAEGASSIRRAGLYAQMVMLVIAAGGLGTYSISAGPNLI